MMEGRSEGEERRRKIDGREEEGRDRGKIDE